VKVAVVCEDHTNDQYILRPVLEAVLAVLGKPHARVQVVSNPRLNGFDSMLSHLCAIIQRYEFLADVIVVAFDLDGEDGVDGRPHKRARIENALGACPSSKVAVVGAVQELEVWALWGARRELGTPWPIVRTEQHPKEVYFDPLIVGADRLTADGGRDRLMTRSLTPSVYSLARGCLEVQLLMEDVKNIIYGTGDDEAI
jgi:hypothetical protein